jgi:hypothetical protein
MSGCIAVGNLVDELFDAADQFRLDFERAQLSGNYTRLDMFKTRDGLRVAFV